MLLSPSSASRSLIRLHTPLLAIVIAASTIAASPIATDDGDPMSPFVPPSAQGNTPTSEPIAEPPAGAEPNAQSVQPDSPLTEEIVVVPPYKIGVGFIHQFDSSIDNGGRYNVSRAFLAGGASVELTPELDFQLGAAFEYEYYRFSGSGTFGGSPWSDVVTVTLSPRFTWALSDHWAITGGPVVQYTGETDAKFHESIQWGGLAAVRYAFDRDHVVGIGLLVLSQLEDDALFLPVPLVDWHFGDGWRLSNVRGPEANPFAGLELVKKLDREWEVAAGAAYVTRRFRLDNSGPAPRGVGQESGVPIYGRLTFRPQPWLRVDAVAGVSVLNRLVLDDRDGHRITASDSDPALVLGIFGSIRF